MHQEANNMDPDLEMQQIVIEEQAWLRKVDLLRKERQRRDMSVYCERIQEKRGPQGLAELKAARDRKELKTMIQDVRVFRQYLVFARTEMKYEELQYLEKKLSELKERVRRWIHKKHGGPKSNHD